jgi:hypothetical protein
VCRSQRQGAALCGRQDALPLLGGSAGYSVRSARNCFIFAAVLWQSNTDISQRVNRQSEFSFGTSGTDQGYTQWLAGRRVAAEELARRMNLPLGQQVEVWLDGGIRLRGKLQLQEEVLFMEEERVRHLELMVDHVAFTYREMESCVRLD